MKQILQSLKTGETFLENIPCPKVTKNTILIETAKTLVSAGTERMLVEFGKASLLGKIKQQPDKVKMVLDKIKTDGLSTTLEAIKAKLDQPIPLGYCHVGRVLSVGKNIQGISVDDRVVSNGHHAEVVRVSQNLCAKIPDNVSDEAAAFTVISAISLQGVRLSQPTLGECYVVIGLGIIGLVTVQLLRANGCRVLGVDFDAAKCALAQQFGAETVNLSKGEDPVSKAEQFSRGLGVDAVIITAATKSNEPLHQAATMCRKRGRIILVGVIGNEFSRADFYEKELTFQVSCSYGPGRYDEAYEEQGQDYPIGFVRWTEQRNFEAVLDMLSRGALDVEPLISHRFEIDQAVDAYKTLDDKSSLGILLNYPISKETHKAKMASSVPVSHQAQGESKVSIGLIGSGNYGARMLAPAFKAAGASLNSVVSSQGISGKLVAKKVGFTNALTDESLVHQNQEINTVVIATRHNLHARQVCQAFKSGKHVFVEKPLALTHKELEEINSAYGAAKNQLLMVGFNRRFASQIQTIKNLLATDATPKSFIMTVNAGFIPVEHWTQDPEVGGGRMIGEGCHFIDLLRYLAGAKIKSWQAECIQSPVGIIDDKAMVLLAFDDGSCGVINYLANGHKAVSKERLEVFCNGKILQLDNFRKLKGFGWKGFKKHNLRKQDKGQQACVQAFVDAIGGGQVSPIPFDELMEVSKISIDIAQHLQR